MKVGERFGAAFIVFDKSSEAGHPREGSFDDPTSGQQHEATLGLGQLDDLKFDAVGFGGRRRPVAGEQVGGEAPTTPSTERRTTRFTGTVMISPERPARDIHQIVEAIVEQLTTLPGSEVRLKLEIEAEIPDGFDRAKVRTLVENANTLGFVEKSVE